MDSKTALASTIKEFKRQNIKFPHLDAEILLSFVLQKPREFLLTHPEFRLTKTQINKFNKLVNQRVKDVPIAYLVGQKEFYGFNFLVNKDVLIPRPETELMVDETKKIIEDNNKNCTVIDVGTGSGCIIITLSKLLGVKNKYYATDISAKALSIAKRNAKLNNIANIKFLQSNLLEVFGNPKLQIKKLKPVILANLPYLTKEQIKKSSSIKREPRLALDGGRDGLDYYRRLFQQIKKLKIAQVFVLLEIDPAQKNKIYRLIKNEFPQANFITKKDLKGHNRLVILELN